MAKASSKPTGVSISRKGSKFTITWTKGEKYTNQELVWSYTTEVRQNNSSSIGMFVQKPIKLNGSVKSRVLTISAAGLRDVNVGVRGKASGKKWSSYGNATISLKAAQKPTLEAVWEGTTPNRTKFNWSAEDAQKAPCSKVVYESVLVNNCPEDYKVDDLFIGADRNEIAVSGKKEDTITVDESGLTGSNARIVRMKAVGQTGESAWVYAYHVYAQPYAAKNVVANINYNPRIGYLEGSVSWDQQQNEMQHPIDTMALQYWIGIPSTNMGLPTSGDWDTIDTPVDVVNDTWNGSFGRALVDDECLFLRVMTQHDNVSNSAYSDYVIALKANLATPTIDSVTPSLVSGAQLITVRLTDASQVPDSKVAVMYQNPDDNKIGVYNVVTNGLASFYVKKTDTIGKVGAYAFVGTYTDNHNNLIWGGYSVDAIMKSPEVWQGVAQSPTITVTKFDDTTATVKWNWPWRDATNAEISWSDHADAWESTDQPTTYIVSNMNAAQWNISDLDEGKMWFFKVRLFYGDGDDVIYGTYSNMESLDLSAAPAIPVLTLSDQILTQDGEAIAAWTYVSNDTTPQNFAQLYRWSVDDDEYVPIENANTKTAQSLTLKASQIGEVGSKTDLVVKVWSESGHESEFSNPVTVTIATPVTCSISSHNLVSETISIDPETRTGSLITLNGGDDTNVRDVTSLQVSLEPVQDKLPSEYQGVEYIESAGVCHIFTDVTPNADSGFAVTFYSNQEPVPDVPNYNYGAILGARDVSGSAEFQLTTYTANAQSAGTVRKGNSNGISASMLYQTKMSATYINGVYRTSEGAEGIYAGGAFSSTPKPITLFALNQTSGVTQWFKGRIYGLSLYDGSTEIRHYFPCYRKSDGVIGMYERYTKQFLTNSGTGTFTKGADTTFPNPDNIVPITGHDSVGANVTGINVWDEEWENGSYSYITGEKESHSLRIRTKNLVSIVNGKDYYICSQYSARVFYYDRSKHYIGWQDWTRNAVLNIPESAYYLTFTMADSYGTTYNNDISINYPSTDHDYHAYTGTTYTVTLPQTVYGGNAELVGGTGKSTMASVDLGTLNWSYVPQSGQERFYTSGIKNLIKAPATNYVPANMVSSNYPVVSMQDVMRGNHLIGAYSDGDLIVRDTNYTSAADFKAAMSGVQLVYELATPADLTLTPQTVSLNEGTNNVWSEQGDVTIRTVEGYEDVLALKELPLEVTVTGTGNGVMRVERAQNFDLERPDERNFTGYEGETIVQKLRGNVSDQIIVNRNELVGRFDDTARYRIIANVSDNFGQSATDTLEFIVDWTHQAVTAQGTVQIIDGVAYITPIKPDGALPTDRVDIYRLSADRPELIYEGVEYNETTGTYETIVDPYPTIGDFGGYRLVLVTANGDYICGGADEDNYPSWVGAEFEGSLDTYVTIIDFGDDEVVLEGNLQVSNSFEKSFERVKYLGGTSRGYWLSGAQRSGSGSTALVTLTDMDTIKAMRRLAQYTGMCHIRTPEGSNFHADIQVEDDNSYQVAGKIMDCSLKITGIDPIDTDGVRLEDWEVE